MELPALHGAGSAIKSSRLEASVVLFVQSRSLACLMRRSLSGDPIALSSKSISREESPRSTFLLDGAPSCDSSLAEYGHRHAVWLRQPLICPMNLGGLEVHLLTAHGPRSTWVAYPSPNCRQSKPKGKVLTEGTPLS